MVDEADTATVEKPKRGKRSAKADAPLLAGADEAQPAAVIEPEPGALDEAIDNLGAAVARDEEDSTAGLDLSGEAHVSAIERMEIAASDFEVDSRSVIPDVRDFLLDQIKCRPKPWSATSSAEQRDVIAACEHAAIELVRKVVEAVRASGAAQPIRCLLLGYTDKGDDIKVDMKVRVLDPADTTRAIVALHEAKGKHVLITVASVDDFRGDGREAEVMPDQNALDFEAGELEQPPADDSDLASAELAEEGDEVEFGGDVEGEGDVSILRTGDEVQIEDYGLCKVGINLETGMIEGEVPNSDSVIDVREATPDELAAERERRSDFSE